MGVYTGFLPLYLIPSDKNLSQFSTSKKIFFDRIKDLEKEITRNLEPSQTENIIALKERTSIRYANATLATLYGSQITLRHPELFQHGNKGIFHATLQLFFNHANTPGQTIPSEESLLKENKKCLKLLCDTRNLRKKCNLTYPS